jgi:NADH-quinone oxidoreductase subunit E
MTDSSPNGQAPTDAPTEFSEGFHEDARKLVLRYPVGRSALLPLLHLVQSEHNYVSEAGIAYCATALGLTKAEVAAVATFYTMYKRSPVGDYLLSVCTNPTCQVAGSQVIFERYKEALGGTVSDPETGVTIEEAECLGICDAAPVVQVNYDMYGPVTDEEADRLLAGCRKGEPPVSSWSGEPAPTFSEVERELSGANDGFGDALVEAARHSIEGYEVTPAYKSGETDIPVTHPGGDRTGHGGQIFAAQFAGEASATDEQAPQPADDVADAADDVADGSGGGEAEDVAADAEEAAATGGDDGSVATGAPAAGGGAQRTDATDATDIPSSVADDSPPTDAATLPPAAADPAGVIPDHPLAPDAPSSAGQADSPTDEPVPPAPGDHDDEEA